MKIKMRRCVGSTLGAESQALREGIGHMIWTSRLLAEAVDPDTDPTEAVRNRGGVAVTDAKSVYDTLRSQSSLHGPRHHDDRVYVIVSI